MAETKQKSSDYVIGIDLGTTNSEVSYVQNDRQIKTLETDSGELYLPSVVHYENDGQIIVGQDAKDQLVLDPENTVYSIKRHMGENNYTVHIPNIDKDLRPEDVSAQILIALKTIAQKKLSEFDGRAVITIPAYFDNNQRTATKVAGQIAGLNVVRLLTEPTAAALAYGFHNSEQIPEGNIMVFDLGGGTLDVSILKVEKTDDNSDDVFDHHRFTVLATSGDTHLGGDDWDEVIKQWIIKEAEAEGHPLSDVAVEVKSSIKQKSEKAKKELSVKNEATIVIPYYAANYNFKKVIKKNDFEDLTANLVERCREPINKSLADAKLTPNDISLVLLVGGSSRMPAVQEMVYEVMGREKVHAFEHPDIVVSEGAAVAGAMFSGTVSDIELVDVTPLTLGVYTTGDIFSPIIKRNTPIPARKAAFTPIQPTIRQMLRLRFIKVRKNSLLKTLSLANSLWKE